MKHAWTQILLITLMLLVISALSCVELVKDVWDTTVLLINVEVMKNALMIGKPVLRVNAWIDVLFGNAQIVNMVSVDMLYLMESAELMEIVKMVGNAKTGNVLIFVGTLDVPNISNVVGDNVLKDTDFIQSIYFY